MDKKVGRPIQFLEATEEERRILLARSRAATGSKREALRADIVLRRLEGVGQREVACELGVSTACVNKWSRRFDLKGLAGLADAPGRGRKPSLPPEKIRKVVVEATRPRPGKRRWSTREMAREAGIGRDSVHRIWRANDIKPHRVRTFKVSNDKNFEEKFWDVIALYLNPPEKALVLCSDEKSQCQALERTQPGLPLGVGHVRTRTHDYVRHGTITLFAALNYLDGKVISRTEGRHTHVEWLRFLKQIDRETPSGLDIHLILDHYCTHKHEKVKAWLKRHPRFHLHFTPTSSSWMNMVERFFADLTADVVLPGSFTSVRELEKEIVTYLSNRNLDPRPYKWKAKGADILKNIQRAKERLAKIT